MGIAFLVMRTGLGAETGLAREINARFAGLSEDERALYLADPSEDPSAEGDNLLAMGDFFFHRVSYPTGRFDPRWYRDARPQDAVIERGVPQGTPFTADKNSPLNLDPTQFTSLGPSPLDMNGCQGCFNFGIVAGRTNVIVSDPVDDSIAYLGSDGGGVWKTTNCCSSGTTWTPVTDDSTLNSIAIGDITLDPNDHDTVYAGTGDLRYGSYTFGSAGLLKSTDAGATWAMKGEDVFNPIYDETVGEFPQYQAIGKVRVNPRNSSQVAVTTKQGVFFSYDSAENWSGPCYTNGFTSQRQDGTGLEVADNGTGTDIWVAIGTRGHNTTVQADLDQNGANGIYHTTWPASGCPASWTLQNSGWPAGTGGGVGFPTNSLGRIDMTISPSDPDVLYAEVADVTTRGLLGVWRTGNGGTTWTQVATPSDLLGCSGDGSQNWYDQGLAVDPNDPDTVFMSTVDVFRSTNGGDTFTNTTCGYAGGSVHVDQHALAFVDGDSSRILAGGDGGVYYSSNATAGSMSYTQLNNSLSTIEFYSGDITANFATSANPGINAGAQDNGSMIKIWSGDPGPATWNGTLGGDGMYARIEPVLENNWYAESQVGNLRVSKTGPTGTYVDARGGWSGDRVPFIMAYELYKYDCPGTGCKHMIAGTHRVWETIQGAIPKNSWRVNSPDLTKGTLADRSIINQLAYSVTDSAIAIVGTNDGNVQIGFNMGQGTTNSATWVNVTNGNAVLPNRPVMDVATHPVTPTIGYAALGGFDENTPTTPGHVYMVTCDATCSTFTWANKSGNLPNIPVNSILGNPKFPTQVFAGTDWGLYFTDDITATSPTWTKFTAGLPSAMIWDMSIDRGFTTLALFTRSRGAFAWPLPTGPSAVELSFNTAANHASPTSATTTLFAATALLSLTLMSAAFVVRRRKATANLTEKIG